MTKEELEKAGYMFLITNHTGPSRTSIQYYRPWRTVSELALLSWEESMQVKNVGTEDTLVAAIEFATADWVLRRLSS